VLINAVANQGKFPGAGDLDDCWIVATWMCANGVRPDIAKGDITWMRGAAGDPDDGIADGGSNTEILKMCRRMWPDIEVTDVAGREWDWLLNRLRADVRPVSLAVLSSELPRALRFGFQGPHQVSFWHESGDFWFANPLAPEGSRPLAVQPADIRPAAKRMTSNGTVRGVLFPTRAEASATRVRFTQRELTLRIEQAVATARLDIKGSALLAVEAAAATIKSL
jgi:hypothetical protein